jgi:hypothetical protein
MPKAKSPKKLDGKETVSTAPTENSAAAAKSPSPVTEASQGASRQIARRLDTPRNESRATLVPINLDDEIRQLAYLLSERRGFTPGHETEDWLTAEHEVLQRYHQQSA